MTSKYAVILLCLMCAALPASAQDEVVSEAIATEIEQLATSGQLRARGVEVASGELLVDVYERNQFNLAWTRLEQVDELLEAIKAAEADGLNPADYHLTPVQAGYQLLRSGDTVAADDRAELDLLFTDSLIRLGYHERFGKVNPYTLDPEWNFRREATDIDAAEEVLTAINSTSLLASLRAQFPRGPFYQRLREGLARYQKIMANGGWPEFPDGPTLKPGAQDERVAVLAQRLAITGDLPADSFTPGDDVYGASLEAGVRQFQMRHGLDADGIVGRSTARALNVSVEDRVKQLKINLERTRWVFDDISDNFILVNIAGFVAYVVRDGEVAWQTRVQVGKPFRKTPVFRDEMKYVVFNPTWTVPYSIATKDILPNVQVDPDYLAKRNFDIRNRNGDLVDPQSIDWSKLSRGNFPYTLVQRPGPDNALGRVKFMFPNEHAVYLHDTPSKHLFGRAERAFSAGCIRVENPFDFAEILLGRDGWTQERFKQVLDSGETRTEFLSEPLPVLLLYWTAEVDEDGTVHFYQDIYDRDQPVADALNARFTLDRPRQ
jgi:murein L,D-transpeptidase YcbB/YkuD